MGTAKVRGIPTADIVNAEIFPANLSYPTHTQSILTELAKAKYKKLEVVVTREVHIVE